MEVLIILLLIWAMLGGLGAWISTQKNRSPAEGLILGFAFGPLGVLIAALLPTQGATTRKPVTRIPAHERIGAPDPPPRRPKPLGTEWMPEFPEPEKKAPPQDDAEDRMMRYLNGKG